MQNKVSSTHIDLSPLSALRQKVLTATALADVLDHFFDTLANKRGFIALGERIEDAGLRAVLTRAVTGTVAVHAREVELKLLRLPEHQFVHGSIVVPGWIGAFVYFEDIARGVLTLGNFGEPTHFGRFTVVPACAGHQALAH